MKKQKEPTLRSIAKTLEEHGEALQSLRGIQETLGEHGAALKEITAILKQHTEQLDAHDELFAFIIEHMATKEDLAIEIRKSESRMMDVMDRMVVDFRGDLTAMTRKVDEKDSALIRVLSKKQAVTKPEVQKLLAMSPFSHAAR